MGEARISANSAPTDAVLPAAPRAAIGIVMLDTRFPRPPGDVGHPDAFGVPVARRVVQGAVPAEIVTSAAALRASPLLSAFVQAMRELEAEGVRAITTSCGFLVLLQQELQAAVTVPVVSSSLLQLPALLASEARVGVLTIGQGQLTREYLAAAGVPESRMDDVVVQGVDPRGEFAGAILGNRPRMDIDRARADVVDAARALQSRAPQLRAIVLECTNMPPHAAAVRAATGIRVWSLADDPALVRAARP